MEKKKTEGNRNWTGKRIAEFRKAAGMSQNDLAIELQKAGVDRDKNAIQLIEHGQRCVRDMELYWIAKTLNVPMEELFAEIPRVIE